MLHGKKDFWDEFKATDLKIGRLSVFCYPHVFNYKSLWNQRMFSRRSLSSVEEEAGEVSLKRRWARSLKRTWPTFAGFEGEGGEASRTWGGLLTKSQQGNGNCSPTSAWNWILPRIWRSLEGFPVSKAALLTERPCWPSNAHTCERRKLCHFKLQTVW